MLKLLEAIGAKIPSLKENEDYNKLVSSDALKDLNLDGEEALIKAVNESFLTIDTAKQHPDITKHYKQLLYGNVDSQLSDAMKEYLQIGDDEVKNILDGLDTPSKTKAALKRAIELSKKGGDSDEKVTKLMKDLEKIQEARRKDLEAYTEKESDYQRQVNEMKYKTALSKAMSNFKLRDDLNGEVLNTSVSAAIDNKLNKIGAVAVVNDGGQIELRKKDDPSLKFYMANSAEEYDFNKALDEGLSEWDLKKKAAEQKKTEFQYQNNPPAQVKNASALRDQMQNILKAE